MRRIDCDQGWPTGRLDLEPLTVAHAAGLSPTADLRDGEVRWVRQPRLPVPSLAGDGFQVGQDQLAILVLGDITEDRPCPPWWQPPRVVE